MSGFLIPERLLISSVFGLMMPAFGYDTLLEVQPSALTGFRLFLTLPTTLDSCAISLLYFTAAR